MTKGFNTYAETVATKMVTHLFAESSTNWRKAARQAGKGKDIYRALQREAKGPLGAVINQLIMQNTDLISSIPRSLAVQVNEYLLNQSLMGRRSSEASEALKIRYPSMMSNTINLVARTETSKATTALTRARSESLGINWYVWRTSKDARVRDSHKIMDGVLVPWQKPPSPEKLDGIKPVGPYHAGNIWNCRCYPEPVIDLDFLTWPRKVFYLGTIVTMSRKRFEAIMNG